MSESKQIRYELFYLITFIIKYVISHYIRQLIIMNFRDENSIVLFYKHK